MNFTKEELRWLKNDLKHLHVGDILVELNQRAKEYHHNNLSVKRSQKQTLQDFQNFIKPGEFSCLAESNVKKLNYQEHFCRA